MNDLKFFRDKYKLPDEYPLSDWEKKELAAEINQHQDGNNAARLNDIVAPEKEHEKMHNSLTETFQQVIDQVSNFQLKKEFQNDVEEKAILEGRKKVILGFLRNVVGDVNNYVNHINNTLSQREDLRDGAEYRALMGKSDQSRRNYHNRLISDLKLAIRQININFNKDFPEKNREEEEKKYQERRNLSDSGIKESLAKRKYVLFPKKLGVFIDWREVPKDPQGEREYIKKWAFDFYADLVALEKDLENEIKKIEL